MCDSVSAVNGAVLNNSASKAANALPGVRIILNFLSGFLRSIDRVTLYYFYNNNYANIDSVSDVFLTAIYDFQL